MMNRREFGKNVLATTAVLALPSSVLSEPKLDMTWWGPHLSQFDNNDALLSTVQRAFGTLWYGSERPQVILSPSRVMGRVWNAIMPIQRWRKAGPWIYSHMNPAGKKRVGFVFCGATWLPNEFLSDEIILINDHFIRDNDHDEWLKFNGWYRASRLIVDDPYGDKCFEQMQQVIG